MFTQKWEVELEQKAHEWAKISHEEILQSLEEDSLRGVRSVYGEEEIDIPVDLLREEE